MPKDSSDDQETLYELQVNKARLSYLLDFLVALDFLCCDQLRAGVKERSKERVTETNRRGPPSSPF